MVLYWAMRYLTFKNVVACLYHHKLKYEGMIVGQNSRSDDMVVNPTKAKQLTNVRASGTDDAIILTPPIILPLNKRLNLLKMMSWLK